jgi:hypothetical protein
MLIIVREFFKIKNERPEEYVENYENALKLLHLQKKYHAHVDSVYRENSRERREPAKKIIKSSRKHKRRQKHSPQPATKPLDNVLNLYNNSSAKKHHVSHSDIRHIHSRPFNLYSSYKQANEIYPIDETDGNVYSKSRKRRTKSRKRLKSDKKHHNKSGSELIYYLYQLI